MSIDLNQNLSQNFKLRELLISETAPRLGIKEQFSPPTEVVNNLTALCKNILQPLRDRIRKSINITSGYRCKKLNTAIGGANNSQHIQGQAADIHITTKSIEELYLYMKESDLPYDQLIQEFDCWVHVSYNPSLKKQRRECLRAVRKNGVTVYLND